MPGKKQKGHEGFKKSAKIPKDDRKTPNSKKRPPNEG
jgi:hypothetical protein